MRSQSCWSLCTTVVPLCPNLSRGERYIVFHTKWVGQGVGPKHCFDIIVSVGMGFDFEKDCPLFRNVEQTVSF